MTALFADITSKRSALNIAKNTFNQASRDLELTQAGSDPFKIKAQAALVSQAEATVAQARSGLLKTMIVAPFSGTVSKVDLKTASTKLETRLEYHEIILFLSAFPASPGLTQLAGRELSRPSKEIERLAQARPRIDETR